MGFILWIVIGALAGWIASMIMKTNAEQGLLIDIIVGIVGAFIGGFLARQFLGIDPDASLITSLITAVVGAVILLAIIKAVRRST